MQNTELLIIGGGPAGLSAAINAASEGVSTILIDANKLGGQAGQSSLIENFLGFPEGISGEELTQRCVAQCLKFGVKIFSFTKAKGIQRSDDNLIIKTGCAKTNNISFIKAKAVLIATGVQYNMLEAEGMEEAVAIGKDVHYGFPSMSENFDNKEVVIIGGANSAGQAAMYLSECPTCRITMIVRDSLLSKRMSSYLVERIIAKGNNKIRVIYNSYLSKVNLRKDKSLRDITIEDGHGGVLVKADKLFVLIGATPNTQWLKNSIDDIQCTENGAILSGNQMTNIVGSLTYNQAVRGVFVAGDVRHGSVKRVAFAAGDGAKTIDQIKQYLGKTL